MRHTGWTITQTIHEIDRFFVECRRVSPSLPFLTILCILAVVLVTPGQSWAAASPYLSPATSATQWLSGHQNGDGSWGSRSDVKLVYTAEAVQAMAAANERGAAYWRGIAWLQNQAVGNIDHASRRILALASHGDNLADDLAYLQQVQNLTAPATGAWGLTEMYESGALDTALAYTAFGETLATTGTPVGRLKYTGREAEPSASKKPGQTTNK
ncbi:MAG: prenyltransferase/squalene oxidase repeat-containing protein [Azonexus sp.]|nr:prenyltransferase/squalene oxidase repeat-containing protein [Azonexus sp.]